MKSSRPQVRSNIALTALLFMLLLGACIQPALPEPTVIPPQPTAELETAIAYPPPTSYPPPSPVFEPSPTSPPTLTPHPTYPPEPTMIPPIDSARLPDLLLSSIRLEVVAGIQAHPLKRITGWEYGLRGSCGGYIWTDDSHLLMYPVTGEYDSFGVYQQSLPLVIHLESGETWLPVTGGPTEECNLAFWSAKYRKLLAFQDGEARLLSLDGKVLQRFEGASDSPLVSPSGRRVVSGNLLFDLQTGRVQRGVSVPGDWFGIPAWSSDETRIFRCCFGYANFSTGKYTYFKLDIEQAGRGCQEGGCIPSHWLPDNTWVHVNWDFYGPSPLPIFPLINPEQQVWVDLVPPGLPSEAECMFLPRLAPNGKSSVVTCQNGVYWVDLQTQVAGAVIGDFQFINWSPNGNFLLIVRAYDPATTRGEYFLQPTRGGDAVPLSAGPIVAPTWRDSNLVFLTDDLQTLVTLDATTFVAKQALLSKPVNPTMFWSPQGRSVTLVSENRRTLFTVNTATGTATEVILTQPVTATAFWSSQGRYLTFVGEDRRSLTTLETATNTVRRAPLAQPIGATIFWSRPGELLACLAEDGSALFLLDVVSGATYQVSFPQPVLTIVEKREGTGLIALADDGSLWWIPDPKIDYVEQLTPPLPTVRDVRWSPSGNQLAFVSGKDVYVVRVASD